MKNIVKNKKTLVISLLVFGMFIAVSLSGVMAKKPGGPPPPPSTIPNDDDWDTWTNPGNMSALTEGNVGIGTDSPDYKLDVIGNRIRLNESNSSGSKTIELRTDGAHVDVNANNADLFLHSWTGNIIMQAYGGNVGIGTWFPYSELHINVDVGNADLMLESSGGTKWNFGGADNRLYFASRYGGEWHDYMVIENDTGNVGIGISSPIHNLDVAKNISIGCISGDDNDYLYFDAGTEHLMWNDTNDRFVFSKELAVGSPSLLHANYIYFAEGSEYFGWSGGLFGGFDVSNNLDVKGKGEFDENVWIGNNDSNDDDYLYFDGGLEYVKWNDFSDRIDISNDVYVSGTVQADEFTYSSPRIHYYSIGGEDFSAYGDSKYYLNPNGGAHLGSTTGSLSAPVHLPHNATIFNIKFFFYDDNTSYNMVARLGKGPFTGGHYYLAESNSSGTAGYHSKSVNLTTPEVVDNTNFAYFVRVGSTMWDYNGSQRIMGAIITYALDEAL